jgi:hypothetical protein
MVALFVDPLGRTRGGYGWTTNITLEANATRDIALMLENKRSLVGSLLITMRSASGPGFTFQADPLDHPNTAFLFDSECDDEDQTGDSQYPFCTWARREAVEICGKCGIKSFKCKEQTQEFEVECKPMPQ